MLTTCFVYIYVQVQIPLLEKLEVASIGNVENIWGSQPSWVQNLTELTVANCFNLKKLFQSSTEVNYETNAIKLPKLKSLKLEYLIKLTSLFSQYSIQLQSLEVLEIRYCEELTFILNDKVCES